MSGLLCTLRLTSLRHVSTLHFYHSSVSFFPVSVLQQVDFSPLFFWSLVSAFSVIQILLQLNVRLRLFVSSFHFAVFFICRVSDVQGDSKVSIHRKCCFYLYKTISLNDRLDVATIVLNTHHDTLNPHRVCHLMKLFYTNKNNIFCVWRLLNHPVVCF